MYNMKDEGFLTLLVEQSIGIPQSHPFLAHDFLSPSSDGRAYLQSPTPTAYYKSPTLITSMRLAVLPAPPVPRTSARL